MKFGIFYEISVPRPWENDTEYKVYQNCLEQVRLADELGFDSGLGGRAPLPRRVLALLRARSVPDRLRGADQEHPRRPRHRRLRAAVQPARSRLAERAAALDIISGGRLEFGTGRSATWTELGGFSADPDDTKKTWDEFVAHHPEDVDAGALRLRGPRLLHAERAVLPKPLPEAAPADVGRRHQPRHRARRRRPRHGQPRRRPSAASRSRSSKVAEYRRRITVLRSRWGVRERSGQQRQLPLLPRRQRCTARRPASASRARSTTSPSSSSPPARRIPTRSYPNLGLLPALRREATSDSVEGRIPEGLAIGNPDRIVEVIKKWEVDGRRPHQLPPERRRNGAAGARCSPACACSRKK